MFGALCENKRVLRATLQHKQELLPYAKLLLLASSRIGLVVSGRGKLATCDSCWKAGRRRPAVQLMEQTDSENDAISVIWLGDLFPMPRWRAAKVRVYKVGN